MNKISKSINALNNIIPDEDISTCIKLRTLADGISKKFKVLNTKFQNLMANAQKNIDEQISVNSDISTADKSSEISNCRSPKIASPRRRVFSTTAVGVKPRRLKKSDHSSCVRSTSASRIAESPGDGRTRGNSISSRVFVVSSRRGPL